MKISWCFFFFLLQPLAIGAYSNKGSKPSGGGGGKGGTQASVGGFKVGSEQIGDRGAARNRKAGEEQSSLKPTHPS